MVLFLGFFAAAASLSWYRMPDVGTLGFDLGNNLPSLFHIALLFAGNRLAAIILPKLGYPLRSPWEHAIITSLILFLLFDSLTPWWVFLLLGFITRTLENTLRLPSGPFFNPAALGAIVISILGFLPTWWGTNFAPRFPLFEGGMSLAGIFTVFVAGFIAYRYKKLPIVASGLLFFCLSYFFLFESNPVPIAFEGTLLFFFLVMACEPKTSPNQSQDQLIYGGLIGILIPLLLTFGFIEAYLGALLIGNLYHRRQAYIRYFRPLPTQAITS